MVASVHLLLYSLCHILTPFRHTVTVCAIVTHDLHSRRYVEMVGENGEKLDDLDSFLLKTRRARQGKCQPPTRSDDVKVCVVNDVLLEEMVFLCGMVWRGTAGVYG